MSDQEFNRLNVLRALRRLEPVSRTDLARASGLTGGSITQITAALLERGLVVEERVAPEGPGRPRVNLRLNAGGAYALSSYISAEGYFVSEVVDLRGEPLDRFSDRIPPTRTLEELTRVIVAMLQRALDSSRVARAAIRRVGIALPAVVDSLRGVVHWMQTMTGTPFPMARTIEESISIPVTIDNGTNVLARAEHWFGPAAGADNFTLINLGHGISASRYRDGTLHVGAHGLNSEMGHSKLVLEHGLRCSCGATGCLDAYCSLSGLVAQCCTACDQPQPALSDLSRVLAGFLARMEGGDARLHVILDNAGTYLGTVLANHINSNDPARIIILSEQWEMPEVFRVAVLRAVAANCLPPFYGLTSLVFRRYEQELFRRGAAALVLEQLYRAR